MKKGTRADRQSKQRKTKHKRKNPNPVFSRQVTGRSFACDLPPYSVIDGLSALGMLLVLTFTSPEAIVIIPASHRINPPGTIDLIQREDGTYE